MAKITTGKGGKIDEAALQKEINKIKIADAGKGKLNIKTDVDFSNMMSAQALAENLGITTSDFNQILSPNVTPELLDKIQSNIDDFNKAWIDFLIEINYVSLALNSTEGFLSEMASDIKADDNIKTLAGRAIDWIHYAFSKQNSLESLSVKSEGKGGKRHYFNFSGGATGIKGTVMELFFGVKPGARPKYEKASDMRIQITDTLDKHIAYLYNELKFFAVGSTHYQVGDVTKEMTVDKTDFEFKTMILEAALGKFLNMLIMLGEMINPAKIKKDYNKLSYDLYDIRDKVNKDYVNEFFTQAFIKDNNAEVIKIAEALKEKGENIFAPDGFIDSDKLNKIFDSQFDYIYYAVIMEGNDSEYLEIKKTYNDLKKASPGIYKSFESLIRIRLSSYLKTTIRKYNGYSDVPSEISGILLKKITEETNKSQKNKTGDYTPSSDDIFIIVGSMSTLDSITLYTGLKFKEFFTDVMDSLKKAANLETSGSKKTTPLKISVKKEPGKNTNILKYTLSIAIEESFFKEDKKGNPNYQLLYKNKHEFFNRSNKAAFFQKMIKDRAEYFTALGKKDEGGFGYINKFSFDV